MSQFLFGCDGLAWRVNSQLGVRLLLLLRAYVVVLVVLRRTSRTAATMSGRSSLVSESVPRHLLGAGMVFARVVLGIFLFPFCLKELAVEVVVGQGLVRVDSLLSRGGSFFL